MKTNYNEENNKTGLSDYSGIAQKLVLIMSECAHVAKDGFNDFHKYSYASASGVLEVINAALVKHKVASVVTPAIISSFDVTNAKGNIEHQVTVGCNILLIDSESGESIDLYGIGTGQDAGDKAVMKAETAAIKYAYLLSMAISTGDDPEADTGVDERNYTSLQPNTVQKPAPARKIAMEQPEQPVAVCVGCGKEISEKVYKYSVARYRKPLCMSCQKAESPAA
jgi:hypothetical protein